MYDLSWLNPTPHATAVYASCSALLPPHATLASRRPATALPGLDFHQLIAPALAGAFLFDHLIGAGEQRRRHLNAEDPRGLEVERQLEAGRLLDRQFAGFLPFEDAADVFAYYAIAVCRIRCIA